MTARGIGKKQRRAPTKRGGRREVSRRALANRPRTSRVKAGRYARNPEPADPDGAPPASPKTKPDPKPRKPTREMLELMRGWPKAWRAAAQKVVDFIETKLRLVKGRAAGHPFLLPPWAEQIVRKTFGPLHQDGTRIARTLFLEVAKKNIKSTLGAALLLYLLIEDGEAGSECLCAATDRKQAGIVFRVARAMAKRSPYLAAKLVIYEHSLQGLEDELSKLEAISSDSGSQDGCDPHAVIVDELHRHKDNGALLEVLETAQGSRAQPLLMMIGTAGEFDPTSVWWRKRQYAQGVIDGSIKDPTWVAAIFSVPIEADWKDRKNWGLANPNLGVSIHADFLDAQFRKALKNPADERSFRRFHLNQIISGESRWMNMVLWDRCGTAPLDMNALKGRTCASGLDLSTMHDLTAHVLAFPNLDGSIDLVARCFMPADRLKDHIENDKVDYKTWVDQGWLTLSPGNVIDFDFIEQSIRDDFGHFAIKELAFDRAGATDMTQRLDKSIGRESGLPDSKKLAVIPFGQGYFSMSEPTKAFFNLVESGKIRHGGNPLFRWQVDCATTIQDPAGNIKIVKPDRRKHAKRVDAVVAAVMAIARAKLLQINEVAGTNRSVYETRGVLSV